jgi:sec-independent protein translocase protein TatB
METAVRDIDNNWAKALLPERDSEPLPYYSMARPVKKRWRVKISATPLWYKARSGTRTKALSGAARVARFRVPQSHS